LHGKRPFFLTRARLAHFLIRQSVRFFAVLRYIRITQQSGNTRIVKEQRMFSRNLIKAVFWSALLILALFLAGCGEESGGLVLMKNSTDGTITVYASEVEMPPSNNVGESKMWINSQSGKKNLAAGQTTRWEFNRDAVYYL
jgi:hypothetical protein